MRKYLQNAKSLSKYYYVYWHSFMCIPLNIIAFYKQKYVYQSAQPGNMAKILILICKQFLMITKNLSNTRPTIYPIMFYNIPYNAITSQAHNLQYTSPILWFCIVLIMLFAMQFCVLKEMHNCNFVRLEIPSVKFNYFCNPTK